MCVESIDEETESVSDSERVIDSLCRPRRNVVRSVRQPVLRGVSGFQQGPGRHHGHQLMLIERQLVYVVARKLLHLLAKPVIVRVIDIFHSTLGLDIMRHAPRRCATATVFLGNRQSNALVECPGIQRHLPGEGASGYRQVFHVDRQWIHGLMGCDFHAIDEPAHSPGPCGVFALIACAGADSFAILGVKLVEGILGMVTRRRKVVCGDLGAHVANGCNGQARKDAGWKTPIIGLCGGAKANGWSTEGETKLNFHRDHGRKRAAAHPLRNVNA